jgi:hypothetical protein
MTGEGAENAALGRFSPGDLLCGAAATIDEGEGLVKRWYVSSRSSASMRAHSMADALLQPAGERASMNTGFF